MVSVLSIIFMTFDLAASIIIPIVLFFYILKKYHTSGKPLIIGILVMLIFSLLLEQMVHSIVLNSDLGAKITTNVFLYALYGGFMAAWFEETGRFLAMKFALKKQYSNDHNAITYGIGHGGFEMMVILGMTMMNNLIYAYMINTGNMDSVMSALDSANQAILTQTISTLIETSPFLYLISLVERLSALALQIALSLFVWYAVTRKKYQYFFIAFLIHSGTDFIAAFTNGIGISVLIVELLIMAIAAVSLIFGFKIMETK